MSDFRQVTETFWASPQIGVEDVREARDRGITLIVNNRPDGEVAGQTAGSEIAAAAREVGLDYCEIPVAPGGFNDTQVAAMAVALTHARGPALAYCRSGTRSTLLWALVQASSGRDLHEIAGEAATAGYDVDPVRPLMELLSRRPRS